MADKTSTRGKSIRQPDDARIWGDSLAKAGEGLRPVGLTIKAIRHRLLAERQAKYADRVLPFKPKGGK